MRAASCLLPTAFWFSANCQLPTAYQRSVDWIRALRSGLWAIMVMMLLAVPAVGGEELPLPPDVQATPRPYTLVMGSQPVQAVGLRTTLSIEQARSFYEKALAKHGWTILEVPWLGESEKQREALRKAVAEHPEKADDPQVTAVLSNDNLQRVRAAARQQLYAVNGSDHVLVGFSQSGNATLLTLARWTGSAENPLAVPASGQPTGTSPTWPAANPCCAGAGVPGALRQLPSSIPAYPTGRMITTGTGPVGAGKRAVMAETYLTADSTDQVVDYYRHHMAYNGWTEVEGGSQSSSAEMEQLLGPRAGQFKWTSLTFQDDRGMCSVVVTEYRPTEGGGGPAESPLLMLVPGGASGSTGMKEQTLIGVNYLEASGLNRTLPRSAPP